jgi:hypothetical protein
LATIYGVQWPQLSDCRGAEQIAIDCGDAWRGLFGGGGRHGSDLRLREQLEPVFVKYGVNVVFSGHEHFYERLRPQKGIHYFTCGGGGKAREGDIEGGPIHAKGFDQGYHFMLVEIMDGVMPFACRALFRGEKP